MTHNTPSDCHMSATEPNLRPSSCPGCGSRQTVLVRCRSGPHYAAINCADCGRHLRWAPKPAPEPTIREDRRHVLSQPQASRPEEPRLATLIRDGNTQLRMSLAEYEGHPYVSLRVFERGHDGRMFPVKGKGLSIRISEIDEVTYGLQRGKAMLEQGHRAEPEPQPAGPDDCDKPQFRPKRGRPAPITFRTEDYPRPRAEEFDEFASGGPDR